jgi:hypothetical protein
MALITVLLERGFWGGNSPPTPGDMEGKASFL